MMVANVYDPLITGSYIYLVMTVIAMATSFFLRYTNVFNKEHSR